jgi:DNA modification methylase
MSVAEYLIGDVFDVLATMPDASVDLVLTSPPFLALRSYLPADHPDKHKEIGSEPTPAEFLDTLLALTAEWGRVLAPHGSICVELGDTYAGRQRVEATT